MPDFQFVPPPEPVGCYEIKNGPYTTSLGMVKKPKWFHRFCMKLCFNITWRDYQLHGERRHDGF